MRFLLDENVSWRLAKLLSPDFGDVLHVNQTPLGESSEDRAVWHFALKENRCIITNDDDFHALSAYHGYPPKVILLKMGNQSTRFVARMLSSKREEVVRFLENGDYGVLEML